MLTRLLAKSVPPGHTFDFPPDECTLAGHLRMVLTSAKATLAATASDQLMAMGLPGHPWLERLTKMVCLSAALHDLGKANGHFQEMIRSRRRQGLRHEWVTVWMLHQPAWRDALRDSGLSPEDFHILWWTVAGHHPGYGRQTPPAPVEGAGSEMSLYGQHPDFAECLHTISSGANLVLSESPTGTLSLTQDGVFAFLRRAFIESKRVWDAFPETTRRFAAVCKACLPGCDVAGSALPRAGRTGSAIEQWISSAFAHIPKSDELREIISLRLDGRPPRPFQEQAGSSPTRVTFLRAGCGSGKTVAAYCWAHTRCPGKRLYICYPTTGTATEGFRDYLFDPDAGAGRSGARLFHGRAEVDLELILDVGDDTAETGDETVLRLEALEGWSTPIVSCTADTVLGLMQNTRRGLYAWPALAGAAFVFDEVHAYDDRLFGTLLRFLGELRGLPVLLMTASLPGSRLSAIRQVLARAGEDLTAIAGPAELESLARYHRLIPADLADPLSEVAACVAGEGNVLWVCNTVNRAMRFAKAAEQQGLCPLIYHSRFRYEDRVERHREVIESFRSDRGVLAICTQVAEVSLDISADLLVSDLAPVPALIQRLGRLNRRAAPPVTGQTPPPTKPFIVVEPDTVFPYRSPTVPDPFEPARVWLKALGQGAISQADLASRWESLDLGSPPRAIPIAWVDGGPVTQVLELREGSPGITVLMEADASPVRDGSKTVARVALPMPTPPKGAEWQQWPRVRGCPVAPADKILYDNKRGATWARK